MSRVRCTFLPCWPELFSLVALLRSPRTRSSLFSFLSRFFMYTNSMLRSFSHYCILLLLLCLSLPRVFLYTSFAVHVYIVYTCLLAVLSSRWCTRCIQEGYRYSHCTYTDIATVSLLSTLRWLLPATLILFADAAYTILSSLSISLLKLVLVLLVIRIGEVSALADSFAWNYNSTFGRTLVCTTVENNVSVYLAQGTRSSERYVHEFTF